MIVVKSNPLNIHQRLAICRTWAAQARNYSVPVVFIVGRTYNESVFNALVFENEVHNDIVLADFADTYLNLTIKVLASLLWEAMLELEMAIRGGSFFL